MLALLAASVAVNVMTLRPGDRPLTVALQLPKPKLAGVSVPGDRSLDQVTDCRRMLSLTSPVMPTDPLPSTTGFAAGLLIGNLGIVVSPENVVLAAALVVA